MNESVATVLLIDDQPSFLDGIHRALTAVDVRVFEARNFHEARNAMQRVKPAFVVSELRVGSDSLLRFLPELTSQMPLGRLVVATIYPSVATAVRLTRMGVAGYLTKPVSVRALLAIFGASQPAENDLPEEDLRWPTLDRAVWEYLWQVRMAAGSTSEAARRLGLDRRSLRRMLAKYPPAS